MVFIGKFIHTLDAKNRIVLPAKLRDDIKRFVITAGFDKCLYIFPADDFGNVLNRLAGAQMKNKDLERGFKRVFLSLACEVEVDKSGRILLPQELMDLCNIKKEVVIIGVWNRIELWSKELWEKYNEKIMKEVWRRTTRLLEV